MIHKQNHSALVYLHKQYLCQLLAHRHKKIAINGNTRCSVNSPPNNPATTSSSNFVTENVQHALA